LLQNALQIALSIDPKFADVIMRLKALFRRASTTNNFDNWWDENAQSWRSELQNAMIQYRNIGHIWELTDEQKQKMNRYYNSNKFLMELLEIENAVSLEARQEIEDNLLLPIAELKRRLPDQYGGIEES
jgi:hypothetical protein